MNGRTNIDLLTVPTLCNNIGLPRRANEVTETGTGALHCCALA